MTLIEAVIAVAVLLVAFVGLYSLFMASVHYVKNASAREAALSLAVERMEQLRALSYSAIGTVNGIPSGTTPQNETVVIDGTTFNRRTLIQYVDNAADGSGSFDSNGISADYKRAKVVVSWPNAQGTSSVSLITNFIPPGLESTSGGGTLSLQVIDAAAAPLENAAVRIVNTTGTTSVDVTTYSSSSGWVVFPGAPTVSGYAITVTKSGYSTAATYPSSGSNANPSPGNLTVVAGQTTSATFAIDRLASITVRTWSPVQAATTTDVFSNSNAIASASNAAVSGGALALVSGGETGYPSSGLAYSTSTAPSYLVSWSSLSWNSTLPSGTAAALHIYTDTAGTLVPDGVLPGNSAGFTTSPVSLTGISTSTYPSLVIGAGLSTSNASNTPQVLDWSLNYMRGPVPLPSVGFTMQGTKTIGTTGTGASVYKFLQTLSTDTSAQFASSTIEWDSYSITPTGSTYDVASQCPVQPLSVSPGSSPVEDLYLYPHSAHTFRVTVRSLASGSSLPYATTTLSKTGYSSTVVADSCGNAFFPNLSSAAYTLSISAAGYTSTSTSVTVSGQTTYAISL